MNKEQLKQEILHVYESKNCRPNDIIMMRTWELSFLPRLNPKEQDLFIPAVNELIDEGKLIYEEGAVGCLRLTERGYEELYQ